MKKNIVQCLILISAVAVLLTAVLSAVGFYNVYEEQVQKQLRTQAQVVRDSLEFTDDPLGYLEATKKAAGDTRFTLIDQNGKVLFDSSADAAGMENHEGRAEVIKARESGFGEATRQSETLGQKTYYAAVRCEDGSVLRAAVALQSVSAVFVNNLPMTLGIVLLMVLVSIPLSRLITRRLLAPIMDAAQQISLEGEENIPTRPIYEEMEPFLNKIRAQKAQIAADFHRIQQEQGTVAMII